MGNWRLIFATFLTLAVIVFVWFFFRQPETLAVENRLSVAPRAVIHSVGVVLRTRQSLGYALATGFIFAPFVAYLSTAQQVFQEAYDTGKLFPAYFGLLALAIGFGALVNDRLLRAWGMHQISKFSTLSVSVISFAAFAGFVTFDSLPPLWLFIGYLGVLFFLMGTIFGNLSALTMETSRLCSWNRCSTDISNGHAGICDTWWYRRTVLRRNGQFSGLCICTIWHRYTRCDVVGYTSRLQASRKVIWAMTFQHTKLPPFS